MTSDDRSPRARPPGSFDQAFLTDVEGVTELLLIRHAQQELPPDAPVGELFDPPLSEQGELQARCVGEAFSATKVDTVFVSSLRRALQTAQAIASHHRLEPVVIEDLREVELFRDMPRDKTPGEVLGVELLKGIRRRWLHERSWDVYPYSESSAEFRKRVINAMEMVIARSTGQRVAVVCHGGVINAYVSHIIGSPYDMFFRPAHTSVNIVVAGEDRRVLRVLNDVHHLRTAEGDLHTY